MSPLCLVDGVEAGFLDPQDRGLHYGDGGFRTLRVADGIARWWDEQLAKLAADAARLDIPSPDAAIWQADLARLGGRMADGVLKLLLTRGSGPRGYRPPAAPAPRRIVCYDPTLPGTANGPQTWPGQGLTLRLCSLRLGAQPRLAGIKHLNRLENVLARAEWNSPEIHEGLLLDEAGRLISGVMSNLFLWTGGRLLTPRLDRCGVAGVARGRLLRLAAATGVPVQETELDLDDLLAADEVMLTNSVVGLVRVARLERRIWAEPVVSRQFKELLDA